MNRTEIQRIAAAVSKIRPDWRADSLETFLTRHFADDPYRDVLIVMAVIASDETTQTPQLALQPGPWWRAVQVALRQPDPDGVTPADRCPYHPDQPKGDACPECAEDARTVANQHQVASHMATIRAAIANAKTAQAAHDHTAPVPGCHRCQEAVHAS